MTAAPVKIVALGCTHELHHEVVIPECDILIHTGDFTNFGEIAKANSFVRWLASQPAKHKILICGNHEVEVSKIPGHLRGVCENWGVRYLEDQSCYVEGLAIYGSPYTVECGWVYGLPDDASGEVSHDRFSFKKKATERTLSRIYAHIPANIDVLVTHGPAHDELDYGFDGKIWRHFGSVALWNEVYSEKALAFRPNLQLHVFSHVHESRGTKPIGSKNQLFAANVSAPTSGRPKELYKDPFVFYVTPRNTEGT